MKENSKMEDSEKKHPKKNDRDKNLTQMAVPTIYFILKRYASEQSPLTPAEIVDRSMQLMKGAPSQDKDDFTYVLTDDMVRAKLSMLAELTVSEGAGIHHKDADENLQHFRNAMAVTFGGTIIEVSVDGKAERTKRARHSYYFKPLLDLADVNMVCGAIASNRYFTDAEKSYLISGQEAFYGKPLLATSSEQANRELIVSDKPSGQNKETGAHPSPTTQSLLQAVNTLYYAISNGYCVSIQSGTYTINDRSNKLQFALANEGREYILHPYAIFWNVGQLYLLATFTHTPEQLRHYRVDRLYDVKLAYESSEDSTSEKPLISNPLPNCLKPYRKEQRGYLLKHPGRHAKAVIDTDHYIAAHPLMSIYDQDTALLPTVVVECDGPSLPILIDTFGAGITVEPSLREHEKKVDAFNRPLHYYTVRLHDIHPDCMLIYCAQHHRSLTVLEPAQLRDQVSEVLQTSLNKIK